MSERGPATGPVWERQRDAQGTLEPNRWFDRFEVYRLLGPGRSLLGAYKACLAKAGKSREKPPRDIPGAWKDACDTWRWKARAEAWDAQQRALDEAKWEERRAQQREEEWGLSRKLADRAELILASALVRQTVTEHYEDGRPKTVVIEPVGRWTLRDAAALAGLASKLARLALGEPTENVDHRLRITVIEPVVPQEGEHDG